MRATMVSAGRYRRLMLLSGAAVLALAPVTVAAQDAPATAPGATPTGGAPGTATQSGGAAQTGDDGNNGEIVVTARNRVEKLQDVPLSITAFSSQKLSDANVRNLRDISYLTPGLSINSGGSEFGVQPIIRGQTNLNGGSGDPNVAVFLDGIYISNNTAINVGLIDIERVEVVKGPVSALYGRNAFAGAINYVSKRPSVSEPHASATGFVGNDGQYSFTGVLSYPIVKDVLGLRLATGYEHFDGSYKDKVNGNNAGGFEKRDLQASLYFTPTPELSVSAAYYYGNDTFGPSAIAYNVLNCGARGAAPAITDPGGTGYLNGTSGTGFCGRFDPDQHDVEVPNTPSLSNATGNSRKVNLASLNVSYDFGFAKITSLTGYSKIDQERFTDFIGRRSGIPFQLVPGPGAVNLLELFGSNTNNKDFSEELRVQSQQDQPFRWQFGGFYFKGRTTNRTIIGIDGSAIPAGQTVTGGFGQAIDYVTVGGQISQKRITQALNNDRQLSGFVGAEYDVMQGLTLSGEYRYTDQKKDQLIIRTTGCPSYLVAPTASCTGAAPTFYLYPNGPDAPVGKFKFSNYRGTIKYAFSPGINLYGSIANGTKAGGFNQRAVKAADGSQPDLTYDPEKNTTYEVGLKNSLFDNKLQLNLAAYHIDTNGIQVSGPSSVPTNAGLVTKNFGSVHTDGFEIELAAQVARGARLNLGLAYADPKFGKDSFDFGSAAGCVTVPACSTRVTVLPANSQYNPTNGAKTGLSLDGLSLPRESNWQVTGGVDFKGQVTDEWQWTFTYNARYETKQYAYNNNISWYGPRTIMNARAGLNNETYSVSLYVNNLTDDHTPETVSNNARLNDFNADQDGYLPVGRQYGIALGAKF